MLIEDLPVRAQAHDKPNGCPHSSRRGPHTSIVMGRPCFESAVASGMVVLLGWTTSADAAFGSAGKTQTTALPTRSDGVAKLSTRWRTRRQAQPGDRGRVRVVGA